MPERYRLLQRELGTGGYRCLVLRDPTPAVLGPPVPIGDPLSVPPPPPASDDDVNPVKEAFQLRWLPGLRDGKAVIMTLPHVSFFRLKRVKTREEAGRFQFYLSEAVPQPAPIPLFESVSARIDAFRDAPGAESAAVCVELAAMVDTFCCSQLLKRKDGSTETSASVGPAALIQLYLDPRRLDVAAADDVNAAGGPGPLALAALSGYVFEADKEVVARANVSPVSFDDAEAGVLEIASSAQASMTLPLVIDQEPEGLYLRLDWRLVTGPEKPLLMSWKNLVENGLAQAPNEEVARRLNDLSDHTLVVKRSVGPVPVYGTALARTPLFVYTQGDRPASAPHDAANAAAAKTVPRLPKYVYVDALQPAQFEGQLVNYSLEMRDVTDRVVGKGEVSVRRRRLDPPTMPAGARAIIELGSSADKHALHIDVELPESVAPDKLKPVVWYQKRPLDACGFFGTDDDMALEEGLRQADLNFEEDADATEPTDWEGHPVTRYLRGLYDRENLFKLEPEAPYQFKLLTPEQRTLAGYSEEAGVVLRLSLPPTEWPPKENDSGARLYVSLQRLQAAGLAVEPVAEPVVESVLRPCDHSLRGADAKSTRIFQIERIPDKPVERDFLERGLVGLHYVLGGDGGDLQRPEDVDPDPNDHLWRDGPASLPFRLRIQFPVLGRNGQSKPGGFRVWLREVVGKARPGFEPIGVVEALPPQVYRYRPYGIDSAKPLTRLDPLVPVPAQAAVPADAEIPLKSVRKLFTALELRLKQVAGSPRLVRAAVVNNDTRDGEQGQPADGGESKNVTLGAEQQAMLLAKIKQTAVERGGALSAASLADVVEQLRNEPPGGPASSWVLPVLDLWPLIAPFVDWAHANGHARDLILPLGTDDEESLDELMREVRHVVDAEKPLRVVAFAVVPACWARQRRLLATVRLCVIPTQTTTDAYRLLVQKALIALEQRGLLHVYQEHEPVVSQLPFDDAGVCELRWAGLQDGWRHQIECAVERLDRYALVRTLEPAAGAAPLLHATQPPTVDDLGPKCIQRRVIPRRMPAPPPPAIRAVPDPRRVAFRIEDTPERVTAAQNLLMRVRGGRITRIVEFDYRLPWKTRHGEVFGLEALPASWMTEKDELVGRTDAAVVWSWSKSREDEVDVVDPLFFVRYRLRIRHRADRILGEAATGLEGNEAQCLPTIDAETFSERIGQGDFGKWSLMPLDADKLLFNIPLLPLSALLTKTEVAAAHRCFGEAAAKTLIALPDLETRYSLHLTQSGQRLVTLAAFTMPGYAAGASLKATIKSYADPQRLSFEEPELNGNERLLQSTFPLSALSSEDCARLEVRVSRGDLAATLPRSVA